LPKPERMPLHRAAVARDDVLDSHRRRVRIRSRKLEPELVELGLRFYAVLRFADWHLRQLDHQPQGFVDRFCVICKSLGHIRCQ